uniref:Histone deacetylase HDT2 n=2 Tax=Anthurium amnicola TaxID=1678845 RepID=A0A1D1XJ53_9ARAE
MEFWGIEVKPGESTKCEPGDDTYLHLSQASLGEVKNDKDIDKDNESIPIYLKFNDQKLVIGTLSADKCPQITYDLVFEKEFELSHNWKNGSVFFVGYKTLMMDDGPDDFTDNSTCSESEDEDIPANEVNESKNELAKVNANPQKADNAVAKPIVKAEELKKADEDDDDDDSSDDNEDDSDDEGMLDAEDGSDDEDEDEDESSDEEDEETPKKADGKKRPHESASKTPAPDKKAKLVTPGGSKKTGGGADGKKGGHTATPHPAKHAGKTPATNDKSKQQTPKSTGSVACKSCTRTFKDDNALQAHTKAKHGAK